MNDFRDLVGRMADIVEDVQRENGNLASKLKKVEEEFESYKVEREKEFELYKTERIEKWNELVRSYKSLKSSVGELEEKNNSLQVELSEVKGKIILSEDNAHRTGRPRELSDEDVEFIRQARADGLTLRKIGEMIEKSHTTVANYAKAELGKKESKLTNSDSEEVSRSREINVFSKKSDSGETEDIESMY